MTTIADGIAFPDAGLWLTPIVDRLNTVGETILAVAGAALDLAGTGDRYLRRVVGHGLLVPVEPGDRPQLTVTCSRVFTGRAGEEQYQFDKGNAGRFGFTSAVFPVRVTRPYPMRQNEAPVAVPAITAAREALWADGIIIYSALLALALGGLSGTEWKPGVSEMIVGPMQPADPQGGQASWQIEATCQLS